jgi:hypothetical protein
MHTGLTRWRGAGSVEEGHRKQSEERLRMS